MKNLKRILTLALVAVISITSLQLSGVVDAEGEQEEALEETDDKTEEKEAAESQYKVTYEVELQETKAPGKSGRGYRVFTGDTFILTAYVNDEKKSIKVGSADGNSRDQVFCPTSVGDAFEATENNDGTVTLKANSYTTGMSSSMISYFDNNGTQHLSNLDTEHTPWFMIADLF